MVKILVIFFLSILGLQAVDITCSSCSFGKDMVKCDYYVVKKHNLKYQNNCLAYAKSIDRDGMHAKAAWYYLLGGDKESAKRCSDRALKMGHHYAAEYRGFVYILNGDMKNAKETLKRFRHRVKNVEYAKKDMEVLKSLYVDFNQKVAYDALYK